VMNLINTFNPQLIVIGGPLGRVIEPFLPIIESVMNQQAFRALTDNVEIKISRLGEDACVMGAIASVLDVVLTDPAQRLGNRDVTDNLTVSGPAISSRGAVEVT
jgi:predicted NBD/HSP70 family sugar kinase